MPRTIPRPSGYRRCPVETGCSSAALIDLGLVDRDDPITEIVATAIVSITSKGEREPAIIKDRALNAIGARRYDPNAA